MIGRFDERRIAYSFKWGFLSDRVFSSITRYKKMKTLSNEDKESLQLARHLFSLILEGEEQASMGKFSMNALESLKIYNRSVDIINTEKFLSLFSENTNLRDLVISMDTKISELVCNELVDINIDDIELFFDLLRELTLEESQSMIDSYRESRGNKKWAFLIESTY